MGGRNWKELVGEDIDEVAAGSEEVGAFGDVLLVIEEVAEGLVGHLVETGAHVVGCSVGGEDSEALETSEGVETIDGFETDVVVEFAFLDTELVVFIDDTTGDQVGDAVLVEAIGEEAVFVHEIGDEDGASGFGDAFGFLECAYLLSLTDEMVEGAEEEGHVGCMVGDERHVAGIALGDIGCGFSLEEDLDVAANEFDGLYGVAFRHEG